MFFYRIVLTLAATSWMPIIYAVKEKWTVFSIDYRLFGILMLPIPILLSLASLFATKRLGRESDACNYQDFALADGEFLPVYLGYFFVSLSIDHLYTMLIVYILIFAFTFVAQTQYFNPVYLLLGYHYYHISTEAGTKIFVIRKGKVIRKKEDLHFSSLRRFNDTTFIERG